MSEFNLTWRRYGLKDNPYFQEPLNIDDSALAASFVGRQKERAELKKVIEMGSVRSLVVGEPGVGKTSLVNMIRKSASQNQFFTPSNEIEINRPISGNELIVLTLSAVYQEIKRREIVLEDGNIMAELEAFYEVAKLSEFNEGVMNIPSLNRQKLVQLFKDVVDKLVNPRYNGVIIHYDNLDNIEDVSILNLLLDVRDFLFTKKTVFIFVGDKGLPSLINIRPRLSQIFLTPSLQVDPLSYEQVLELLEKRVNIMRSSVDKEVVCPHTEEVVKILFELHNGNLRSILNSLTIAVKELPKTNAPVQITNDKLRQLLVQKVKESYLSKLTKVEQDIVFKMLQHKDFITPTELSKQTGKSPQNISSKYLKKFVDLGVVRQRKREGRNVYYEVLPEINWWRLSKQEKESQTKIKKLINPKIEQVQMALSDYFE